MADGPVKSRAGASIRISSQTVPSQYVSTRSAR